jgi:hypothetical protein
VISGHRMAPSALGCRLAGDSQLLASFENRPNVMVLVSRDGDPRICRHATTC